MHRIEEMQTDDALGMWHGLRQFGHGEGAGVRGEDGEATSVISTRMPREARAWAMPLPITPAPMTTAS